MAIHVIQQAVEELGQAFQSFKDAQEERMQSLEKKSGVDPLTEEKLQRIGKALDAAGERLHKLDVLTKRPTLSGEGAPTTELEHKQAFAAYIRRGNEIALRALEQKSLNGRTAEDGGYLLPTLLASEIYSSLQATSVMREIASVATIAHHQYELIIDDGSKELVKWASEEVEGDTGDQKVSKLIIPLHQMYERQRVAQSILEDSALNVEKWLLDRAALDMARAENKAFVIGDGHGKPKGFLAYPTAPKAEWGKFMAIKTGRKGELSSQRPEDQLLDAIHAIPTEYLQGAVWVMSRSALSEIRKLKTAQGDFILHNPRADDTTLRIFGYPVYVLDAMPALAKGTASKPIAFGNFKRGFQIVDRNDQQLLRDPYTVKPDTEFFISRRVGSAVKDFNAICIIEADA